MAKLFNDPAIDSIVRYSAGGATPTDEKDKRKALLARLDALAAAKQAAATKAATYGTSTSPGQEGEAPQTHYYRIEGGGDGERSVPVDAKEFNAAQDRIDWGTEAKKIATETGYDASIIPGGSNPYMYGAMRDQMQGHSDPLRMLRLTSLEPTKGNIGMAEMFYNNPNATRGDLESAFKQANKGGGALRQVLGDDIVNSMGQIGSIVGNAILPGFGGAFGNAAGSMVAGKKFNAADAALAFAGGQAGDYLNTTFSEIGKTGANAIAGAGQGAISGSRDGIDGMLKGAAAGAGASLIGNAGRLAGNEISALTGNDLVGKGANMATKAALTGKDLKTSDLVGLGLDGIKGSDAYQQTSKYLSQYAKDMGLDSITIDGISIPGVDMGITISAKDRATLQQLAGLTPAGKKVNSLVSTLNNPGKAVTSAASGYLNKIISGGGNAPAAPVAGKPASRTPAAMSPLALMGLMSGGQKQEEPEDKTADIKQVDVLDFLNSSTPGDSYADLINMTRST